jgi:hypothetical protein
MSGGRDLMTRYVQMRLQYEEEKAAVQQLTDLLDEQVGHTTFCLHTGFCFGYFMIMTPKGRR